MKLEGVVVLGHFYRAKEDRIANKTIIKVSSWGGYAYIDIENYIDGESVYEALIYFK